MLIPAEKAVRVVDGLTTGARAITDRLRERLMPIIPEVRAAKDRASARAIMQPRFDRAAAELRELVANSISLLEGRNTDPRKDTPMSNTPQQWSPCAAWLGANSR